MLTIPVGDLYVQVQLVQGIIELSDGRRCLGCADSNRMLVRVSTVPPPDKRLRIFWHELGHIIKEECDAAAAEWMDEEHLCNVVSLGCSGLDAMDLARVTFYLATGIAPQSMAFFPGISVPIPVLSFVG